MPIRQCAIRVQKLDPGLLPDSGQSLGKVCQALVSNWLLMPSQPCGTYHGDAKLQCEEEQECEEEMSEKTEDVRKMKIKSKPVLLLQ